MVGSQPFGRCSNESQRGAGAISELFPLEGRARKEQLSQACVKLLILLRDFPRQNGMRFTFLGDSCAYELCSNGQFDRLVHASPRDASADSPLGRELAAHDVLISAMEFRPIPPAKRAGLTTILFDSLFWMWPEMPSALSSIDLYLCQNFLGVAARLSACGRPANLVVVPPLTLGPDAGWRAAGDSVILNLGRMDNPHAPQPMLLRYAECMLSLVHQACRAVGVPLEVHGRGWVMRALRDLLPDTDVTLSSLPLEDFVRRLRQTRGLITSPGLEVLYEAFTLGVPTCILPPQNNSQAYQCHQLKREIPLLSGLEWQDVISTDLLSRNRSPAEMIQATLGCVTSLSESRQAQEAVRDTIESFLRSSSSWMARRSSVPSA